MDVPAQGIAITALGWAWIPLGLALLWARPRWLIGFAAVSAVLQSPAVVTLTLAAGPFGITPFNFACGLVAIRLGLSLARREPAAPRPRAITVAYGLWTAFFFVSLSGALILPHVFDGVPVHPALVRGITYPTPVPNAWSVSHLAQAINSFALWLLFTWVMVQRDPTAMRRGLAGGIVAGGVIAVLAGLQQRLAIVGLVPMFEGFWASNPGYNQWFFAPEYGPASVHRVGLPFTEPSYASVYFAGVFAAALCVLVYGARRRRLAAFVTALGFVMLLNTAGTSGLAAALLFVVALAAFHLAFARRATPAKVTHGVLAMLAAGLLAGMVLYADFRYLHLPVLEPARALLEWTLPKIAEYRGSTRDLTNLHVFTILSQTFGLGAGAGSTRASSWFFSLLGNTGVAGLALFLAAVAAQAWAMRVALRERQPLALGAAGATVAVFLGVGLGVPDQNWPVVWIALLAGFVAARATGVPSPPARPLRLLLVTQWFDPEPTIKGLAFAKALAERGHEVEVLTGFPNYPGGKLYPGWRQRWCQRERIEGVRVLRVPLYPSHDASARARIANYASFAVTATLGGLFGARRPDLVYAYQPPLTTVLAARVVALLRDVPLVIDIQDLWPDTLAATGMLRSARMLALIDRGCRLAYRGATAIAVLSPGFRAALLARGVPAAKVEVIYNWADEAALGIAGEAPAAMRGRFNVVFAGTMGKAQALDAVLDAARRVAAVEPRVQFVFVGGGIDVERLRARAADEALANVVFLPRMPMHEIGRVLHAADALLVHLKDDPLFAITVPSKTQAYMAVGRPVIMAVRGDAARLIQEAGAGIVADPESPESLAEAVLALAALPPARREALGAAGAAHYRAELSLHSGVRRFEALFLRAIHDHGRPVPAEDHHHVANHP